MAQIKVNPHALIDCAQRLGSLVPQQFTAIEDLANKKINRKLDELLQKSMRQKKLLQRLNTLLRKLKRMKKKQNMESIAQNKT